MKTVIYYMDMSSGEIASGKAAERLADGLSDARREKIRSLRFEEDRLLSLGAGLLMDYGLRQYGLREREVLVSYKKNRKPYLPQHPDIHLNLSHSGTIALAAFGGRELGCDVERVRKADYKVSGRFFAEGEKRYLESIEDPEEKNTAFYRLWTLKESYMKTTGDGVRLPLNEFCIHLEDPEHLYAEAGGRLPCQFWEYSLPEYRIALCMENTGDPMTSPELRKITPADLTFRFS